VLAMPPMREWLSGAHAIAGASEAMVFGPAGPGAFTLRATEANGVPAFAAFAHGEPVAIHVLDIRDGAIAAITAFMSPSLFPYFGF
jgi:RNA polymerase sigma-70 factor (ECF subfamily)